MGAADAESDRAQRFADRDDHNEPVPLGEVCGVHAPSGGAAELRPEEADDEREGPDRRPPCGRHERGDEDERRTWQDSPRHPQHGREHVRLLLAHERVEPDKGGDNGEERDAEHESLRAERPRNGKRSDEERGGGEYHHRPDEPRVGVAMFVSQE
jgi:hypothetical protein